MAHTALVSLSSRYKNLWLATLMAATLAVTCPAVMAEMPRATLDAMQKSAEQGNALAQFNLGQVYRKGDGIPVDMAAAASWFQKGADQNEPNSQFNLAIMYANGDGVPRDFVKAHMWWHIASVTAGSAGPGERIFVGAWNNMSQIAKEMSKEQVESAYRQSTEWMAAHPKKP